MREILFRGKRIANGKWVYGDLMHTNSMRGGERLVEIWVNLPIGETDPNKVEYGVVDSSTIGQFTGQTDMAGRRIFDGDIVDIRGENGYWQVEWDNHTSAFVLGNHVDMIQVTFDNYYGYEMEVIGNIHDDPALLAID